MSWSSRRIRRFAEIIDAQVYLEIGVRDGETFFEVDLPEKDAVDPNFVFDASLHSNEGIRFFEETSDVFWTSPNPKIYDILFIDGLHTFEQTLRDMISSMRYSHERTIWLLDDTLPCDVFSAIPDQERSFHERKKMNIPGLPWHGDVFKMIFFICDFLPIFNFLTIVDSGNPQTVVWYSPREEFKNSARNLEAISRLTFFDIEPNINLFNCVTEDDAVDIVRKDFTRIAFNR